MKVLQLIDMNCISILSVLPT